MGPSRWAPTTREARRPIATSLCPASRSTRSSSHGTLDTARARRDGLSADGCFVRTAGPAFPPLRRFHAQREGQVLSEGSAERREGRLPVWLPRSAWRVPLEPLAQHANRRSYRNDANPLGLGCNGRAHLPVRAEYADGSGADIH